jgi:biopolymer transport protein ExbD
MRLPNTNESREMTINMTPMIDVVFLLIIFFLVSSHLARQESQLPLPLPAADSGEEPADQQQPRVVINIDAGGGVTLAGRAVSSDELRRRLQAELSATSPDLEVRIRTDRTVPFRVVRPILLAASQVGVWNVTFAVLRREDLR